MSLFTEYEKLRTARKSLTIGSRWEIVESTYGTWGTNAPGEVVQIAKVDLTFLHYHYFGHENYPHRRDIESVRVTI